MSIFISDQTVGLLEKTINMDYIFALSRFID